MHIVLDDTAMASAGQGNVLASRLIHRAHAQPAGTCTPPPARSSKPIAAISASAAATVTLPSAWQLANPAACKVA
jgi:hypothetical protein